MPSGARWRNGFEQWELAHDWRTLGRGRLPFFIWGDASSRSHAEPRRPGPFPVPARCGAFTTGGWLPRTVT